MIVTLITIVIVLAFTFVPTYFYITAQNKRFTKALGQLRQSYPVVYPCWTGSIVGGVSGFRVISSENGDIKIWNPQGKKKGTDDIPLDLEFPAGTYTITITNVTLGARLYKGRSTRSQRGIAIQVPSAGKQLNFVISHDKIHSAIIRGLVDGSELDQAVTNLTRGAID